MAGLARPNVLVKQWPFAVRRRRKDCFRVAADRIEGLSEQIRTEIDRKRPPGNCATESGIQRVTGIEHQENLVIECHRSLIDGQLIAPVPCGMNRWHACIHLVAIAAGAYPVHFRVARRIFGEPPFAAPV